MFPPWTTMKHMHPRNNDAMTKLVPNRKMPEGCLGSHPTKGNVPIYNDIYVYMYIIIHLEILPHCYKYTAYNRLIKTKHFVIPNPVGNRLMIQSPIHTHVYIYIYKYIISVFSNKSWLFPLLMPRMISTAMWNLQCCQAACWRWKLMQCRSGRWKQPWPVKAWAYWQDEMPWSSPKPNAKAAKGCRDENLASHFRIKQFSKLQSVNICDFSGAKGLWPIEMIEMNVREPRLNSLQLKKTSAKIQRLEDVETHRQRSPQILVFPTRHECHNGSVVQSTFRSHEST